MISKCVFSPRLPGGGGGGLVTTPPNRFFSGSTKTQNKATLGIKVISFTSFAVILMKKLPSDGSRVSRQSPKVGGGVVATSKYFKSPFRKISTWYGAETYRTC